MGKWIAIISLIWLVSFIISLAFIWKKVPAKPFTSGRGLRNYVLGIFIWGPFSALLFFTDWLLQVLGRILRKNFRR